MKWAVVLVACGCGRWGFGSAPSSDASAADAPADLASEAAPDAAEPPRMAVMVGGLSPLPAGALDLGVTATPTGFTVTFAAVAGSNMYGLNLDGALAPDADWRTTSATNTYVGTTMTWTGSPMTTMTNNAPLTYIKRYVANLSSYTQMDAQNGIGAKPAYATANSRWFYAIVDATVLHVREIGSDGTTIGSVLDVPSAASGTAIAAALASENAALFAIWSQSAGACEIAAFDATGTLAVAHAPISGTCAEPRIAAEPGRGVAVFEGSGAIHALTIDESATVSPATVIAQGSGVRIVPDPAVGYWLAWTAPTGLAAAKYTPGGTLAPVPLAGLPAAAPDAYELVTAGSATYLVVAANRTLYFIAL